MKLYYENYFSMKFFISSNDIFAIAKFDNVLIVEIMNIISNNVFSTNYDAKNTRIIMKKMQNEIRQMCDLFEYTSNNE